MTGSKAVAPTGWRAGPLPRHERVYVAGQRGLVGSAVVRRLRRAGFVDVVGHDRSELDLRDSSATFAALAQLGPTTIVMAAARVGGIAANVASPVEFLEENLQIQLSVLGAARRLGVKRLLFLGSSCIYPRLAPQPIPESALLTGALESTNESYAIAKIAGVTQVRSVRKEFGLPWISAMPTNLYGPNDSFDLEHAHVLPALLRRCHEAKQAGAPTVSVWGSGRPRREFLHVDDLADACLFLLEHFDGDDPINVGTGKDVSIRELAELVASVVGYDGALEFDPTRPDGTPRKLLDVSRLDALGWSASIDLLTGLRDTYTWFQDRVAAVRT